MTWKNAGTEVFQVVEEVYFHAAFPLSELGLPEHW